MKTIIAGTRTFTDYGLLEKAIHSSRFEITEVVCGLAKGADSLGEQWAIQHNIPVAYFPAEWKLYGKKAGPLRNKQMAEYADKLIALWDGESKGTKNMIIESHNANLKTFVFRYDIYMSDGMFKFF